MKTTTTPVSPNIRRSYMACSAIEAMQKADKRLRKWEPTEPPETPGFCHEEVSDLMANLLHLAHYMHKANPDAPTPERIAAMAMDNFECELSGREY